MPGGSAVAEADLGEGVKGTWVAAAREVEGVKGYNRTGRRVARVLVDQRASRYAVGVERRIGRVAADSTRCEARAKVAPRAASRLQTHRYRTACRRQVG